MTQTMTCTNCIYSKNFKKNGNSYGKQRYMCKDCKKSFLHNYQYQNSHKKLRNVL